MQEMVKLFSIHIHTSSTAHLGACDSLLLILGVSRFQIKADQVKSNALLTFCSLLDRLLARFLARKKWKKIVCLVPVSSLQVLQIEVPTSERSENSEGSGHWALQAAALSPLQPTQPTHSTAGL